MKRSNTDSKGIPNCLYGNIARNEAKIITALFENDVDFGDPRIYLRDALIKSGLSSDSSAIIALDVCSNHQIDDEYLIKLKIKNKKLQNKIYKEIINFKMIGMPN